jgi:putative polyketide hydroxylase
MTSTPGARGPHAYFTRRDGARVATVDLLRGGFVLLAGPEGASWIESARQVSQSRGIKLDAYRIAANGDLSLGDSSFENVFEVMAAGCVLMRPDGHVGFRADKSPDSTSVVLDSALSQILSVPHI